jgi:hypothetical protein
MTQALVYWLGGIGVLFLAFIEVVQLKARYRKRCNFSAPLYRNS